MSKLRKAGKMRGSFGADRARQLFLREQRRLKEEVCARDQGRRRNTYPTEKWREAATPPDRKLRCDNPFNHDALHSVARPSSSASSVSRPARSTASSIRRLYSPPQAGEGKEGIRADDNLLHVVSTWALPVLGCLVSTAN